MGAACSGALGAALCPGEYQSVKFVRVQNAYLAGLHRVIFVVILAYVIVYQLVLQKGYQSTDAFSGAPDIKVKGVARTPDGRVFDAIDLTRPALEESAVFVQTNAFETRGQRRGRCSGVDVAGDAPAAISEVCDCGSDPERCPTGSCPAGLPTANGFTTGRCINTNASAPPSASATQDDASGPWRSLVSREGMGWMCEVEAWCPVEDEKSPRGRRHRASNALREAANMTLFVRVDGHFPQLAPNLTLSNFGEKGLVWNENLFYLGDIVAAAALQQPLTRQALSEGRPARLPTSYFDDIVERGAVINVDYVWDCDLDRGPHCTTSLQIHRIDGGHGFNYRTTSFPKQGERDLEKLYGLRVVFRVVGSGGKFDAVQLGTVLGAGLGLLGIATVVADLLLYTSRGLRPFQQAKFEAVLPPDATARDRQQQQEQQQRHRRRQQQQQQGQEAEDDAQAYQALLT